MKEGEDLEGLCSEVRRHKSWLTGRVLYFDCHRLKGKRFSYCLNPELSTECQYHPLYDDYKLINRGK